MSAALQVDDEDRDDYVPATPEARLEEWAIEMQHRALSYFPSETVEYKLMREGAGASHSSQPGDGGMFSRMLRMKNGIARDNRTREMTAAYLEMPGVYRAICKALYLHEDRVHRDDVVRSWTAAAKLCGLKDHEFRSLRERMLGWVSAKLDLLVLDGRHARKT